MKTRRISDDLDDDGSVMKTCCGCLDVRIGTIALGFLHLLIHVAGVVMFTQILLHPAMYEEKYIQTYGTVPKPADNSVALAIAFCSFVITSLLIYGAVTRQPSYLLPFFCLQVFDFCVNLLGALGAVSYIPELKMMLKNNQNFPYADDLDKVDMRSLMMTVILLCLIVLLIKGYLICCVWSCYKALVKYRIKQATQTFMYEVDGADSETHGLLPNYEDAVKDTPKESPPPYTTS